MGIEDTKAKAQEIIMNYSNQEPTYSTKLALMSELSSITGMAHVNVDMGDGKINAKLGAWDNDDLEEWLVSTGNGKSEEDEHHEDEQFRNN